MTRKPPKVVVKEPRQPRPRLRDELTITTEAPGTGTATGGQGRGTGPGTGDGPATGEPCDQALGPCGTVPVALTLPELPPPPPPPVRDVTPEILRGLRIRGETAIHPPREVYDEMAAARQYRTTATIKLCLAPSGAVSSVSVLKSTAYPAYDRRLVETAGRWIYRPYTVNGTPVPACGVVTFQYAMR
jgi:TonB family protein